MVLTAILLGASVAAGLAALGQTRKQAAVSAESGETRSNYALDALAKGMDDVAWHQLMDPVAVVEKIVYTGCRMCTRRIRSLGRSR